MLKKLLLVEDNKNLAYVLKEYLLLHNYSVVLASDGIEGFQKFDENLYDLILVDIMLPKEDGFSLVKRIKSVKPEQAIIFLTARTNKVDKLKGFRLGCDDYINKPVDEEELIARIEAVLRRSKPIIGETIKLGLFQFLPKQQLLIQNDKKHQLSKKETDLLQLLCYQMNSILDRNYALRSIWGDDDYFKARSMDVYIHKLRSRLKSDPSIEIKTIHGQGFSLINNIQ